MNALGVGRDLRSFPVKPALLKPAARSAVPPKITAPPPVDNAVKVASTCSFTGSDSAPNAAETKTAERLERSEEARPDESLSEQSRESPEDINDFFEAYHALDESDDQTLPDPEEQRQQKMRRLEMLEGQYRQRLLLVENLLERLVTANQRLTQWHDSAATHPEYQTLQSF